MTVAEALRDEAAETARLFQEQMTQAKRVPAGAVHNGLSRYDPGAYARPPGSIIRDNLGGPGAHRLAEVIRKHWRAQGHDISITVEPTEGFGTIHSIRSNLLDGKPREICHPSTSCARRDHPAACPP
jgi:hypothetical protein